MNDRQDWPTDAETGLYICSPLWPMKRGMPGAPGWIHMNGAVVEDAAGAKSFRCSDCGMMARIIVEA